MSPAEHERRTRRWPVKVVLLMTFAQADLVESILNAAHFETTRVCWGGQWLEVRARKAVRP